MGGADGWGRPWSWWGTDPTLLTASQQLSRCLVSTPKPSLVRLPSPFLSGASSIASAFGESHTCVLVTGGGVKCWGWNFYGQLGIGSTEQQSSPVDVKFKAGVNVLFECVRARTRACARVGF